MSNWIKVWTGGNVVVEPSSTLELFSQPAGPPPFPTLFDAVDAYVEAHKTDNHALYDAWNYSNGFDRHGALVGSLAPAFGITEDQLDAMFRAGANIKG